MILVIKPKRPLDHRLVLQRYYSYSVTGLRYSESVLLLNFPAKRDGIAVTQFQNQFQINNKKRIGGKSNCVPVLPLTF